MTDEYIVPKMRWGRKSDINEMVEIDYRAFEYPWFPSHFHEAFASQNVKVRVADAGGVIVGYVFYLIEDGVVTLLNLAVLTQLVRYGVGTFLIKDVKSRLLQRRRIIEVYVRERNLAAQLFFKSQGFICKSTHPGYYNNCDDAAYLFEYQAPLDDLYSPCISSIQSGDVVP